MGRPTLIQEKKHPYYFKPRNPAESPPDFSRADAPEPAYPAGGVSVPEFLIEQVMEGLSDACILIDRGDRMVYVNSAAKTMLQPKGRILGRKLTSILADAQLSTLACEAYQTGKPLFSTLTLQFPGIRWRDIHQFHASIVPLWIASTRRLVRIALRDAGAQQETKKTPVCGDAVLQMRNPLSILQGYLENLLDGLISDPGAVRQSLLTMRKHTQSIERLLESCK